MVIGFNFESKIGPWEFVESEYNEKKIHEFQLKQPKN
jgi:hypothetical protein